MTHPGPTYPSGRHSGCRNVPTGNGSPRHLIATVREGDTLDAVATTRAVGQVRQRARQPQLEPSVSGVPADGLVAKALVSFAIGGHKEPCGPKTIVVAERYVDPPPPAPPVLVAQQHRPGTGGGGPTPQPQPAPNPKPWPIPLSSPPHTP